MALPSIEALSSSAFKAIFFVEKLQLGCTGPAEQLIGGEAAPWNTCIHDLNDAQLF